MIVLIGGAGNTQAYFRRFIESLRLDAQDVVRFVSIEQAHPSFIRNLFEEGSAHRSRVLIGFSLGANAALLFSAIHPVDRLILVSPVSLFDHIFDHNGGMTTSESYKPLKAMWWKDLRPLLLLVKAMDGFSLGRRLLRWCYKVTNPRSPANVVSAIYRRGYTELCRELHTYVTGFDFNRCLERSKARRKTLLCGHADEYVHLAKRIMESSNDPSLRVKLFDADHHVFLNNPREVLYRIPTLNRFEM